MIVTNTLECKPRIKPINIGYYGDVIDGKKCFFKYYEFEEQYKHLNTKRKLNEDEYIYDESKNLLTIILPK